MQNYTGKKVFLGMDVHKKTYAVTAICDGQIIKRDTLRARASASNLYLTARNFMLDIALVNEMTYYLNVSSIFI